MMWGNNANYMKNPCNGCTKERLRKENGKYIRCDMECETFAVWKSQRKELKEESLKRCDIAYALDKLEHKKISTRKRKAV